VLVKQLANRVDANIYIFRHYTHNCILIVAQKDHGGLPWS
jgi:hypothetical protein